VDLGCWPGAWLQILAERVGPEGRVVGVDLRDTDPLGDPVEILTLDFTEPEGQERIVTALGRPASLVLSDAAPKLTGIADVDRAGLEELFEGALQVAERVLEPQGCLVVKGFPGPPADEFRVRLRSRFRAVSEVRPKGKRGTSKEFYWVATPEKPRSSGRLRRPGRSRRRG
jgi:23S rRNA (uridine2552-2'-O)-methyltransferase